MEKRFVLFLFLSAVIMSGYIGLNVMFADGEIVIQSDDPNAIVTVRRHEGDLEKNIELINGQGTTRLPSGMYDVVIRGDNADQFKITPNTVELNRGQRQVVRIEHRVPPPKEQVAAVDPVGEVEDPEKPNRPPETPNEGPPTEVAPPEAEPAGVIYVRHARRMH